MRTIKTANVAATAVEPFSLHFLNIVGLLPVSLLIKSAAYALSLEHHFVR
jgi:hypothetical protein